MQLTCSSLSPFYLATAFGNSMTNKISNTYVQDTYPQMQLTCSDLSPFYLSTARENHEYWQRMRQPSLAPQDQTKFLQTAAEKIAAADNSYDVVRTLLPSAP